MHIKAAALIVVLVLSGCATNGFPPRADERAQRGAELASMQRRAAQPGPSWRRASKRVSSVKVGKPTSSARPGAKASRAGRGKR